MRPRSGCSRPRAAPGHRKLRAGRLGHRARARWCRQRDRANELYATGCGRGSGRACAELAALAERRGSRETSVLDLYDRACGWGYSRRTAVARLYEAGTVVARDENRALSSTRSACMAASPPRASASGRSPAAFDAMRLYEKACTDTVTLGCGKLGALYAGKARSRICPGRRRCSTAPATMETAAAVPHWQTCTDKAAARRRDEAARSHSTTAHAWAKVAPGVHAVRTSVPAAGPRERAHDRYRRACDLVTTAAVAG